MIRPQLHEVLGYVVHARIGMDLLKAMILSDMQAGYRPTYRGHDWGHQHFEAVEKAGLAIQAAFDYLKWIQFPEVDSRWREAEAGLEQLEGAKHQADSGGYDTAELPPGGDTGQEGEDFLHVLA